MGKPKQKKNTAEQNKRNLESMKLLGALNHDRRIIFERGQNLGYCHALTILFWILHTEFGFGEQRLKRCFIRAHEFCKTFLTYDPENVPGVTLEDMAEALYDECKIKLDVEKGLIEAFQGFDDLIMR